LGNKGEAKGGKKTHMHKTHQLDTNLSTGVIRCSIGKVKEGTQFNRRKVVPATFGGVGIQKESKGEGGSHKKRGPKKTF